MPTPLYDVIVVGLGAMGSSAAWWLAEAGLQVLGVDRFHPPHQRGSSGGRTRIFREAYFEDPSYVRLARQARTAWRRLESETGATLLHQSGGLTIGPPEGPLVTGVTRSAALGQVPVSRLSPPELSERFPQYRLPSNAVAIYEPGAGILFPERCIDAALVRAVDHGATCRFGEPMESYEGRHGVVHVQTSQGEYRSRWLVLALGPWLGPLRGMELPVSVTRQVVVWFRADDRLTRSPEAPLFLQEVGPGTILYGIPDQGEGVKAALHRLGPPTTSESTQPPPTPRECEEIRLLLHQLMPGTWQVQDASVCFYTNMPDGHFMIDHHPANHQVLVVSACSGHGFKFASALGQLVCAEVLGVPKETRNRLFRWRSG